MLSQTVRIAYGIAALLLMLAGVTTPVAAAPADGREREIRKVVSDFVMSRTADLGWEVRIRSMSMNDPLKLPEGTIDYEVVAPQQWEGWGPVSIAVLARQNDRLLRNIPVRLDVEALADTVVTLHQIELGATLSAADLTIQKRNVAQNSQRIARSIDEVEGKRARSTIKANQPLRLDQLEKVPLIKSGQLVTILAENELLRISVSGKARSAGALGDIIRVQNVTSLKEFPARILNATTVQVVME